MEVGQSQLLFEFTLDGDLEPMYSCLGIDGSILSPGDLLAWAGVADGYFDTFITPYLSASVNHSGTIAQHRFATGVAEQRAGGITPGGRSANMLTQNTAYLVHKNTAATGRGKRGRMYLPGVPDDKVSNAGVIAGGEVDDWNLLLGDFFDSFPPEFLVVNHGPTTGSGSDPITDMTLDTVVATQRRRLRR